jgi:glycosyltransferase involved in cell wall biosynthesis
MSRTLPLSVIVSTCESGATLEEALAAIRASDLPRDSYELIVVDDASRDRSVAIAARYADTVVKLPLRRCGPAYARNRGVELSRGEVVAFVDGDVVIPADTLTGMLAILEARPEVDAVAASRHERPGARNFVSQYWNLLLRFGEERYSSKSAQFPTGCGAVRREVFIAAGMYDEWRFASASLECLELGERLLARGVGFAMLSAPVHVLIQIVAATALVKGWILRDVLGDVAPDATTQAYAEVGLEVWPPIPRRR